MIHSKSCLKSCIYHWILLILEDGASSLLLYILFVETGLPPGVCNLVFGTGPKAGAAIVKHPDVPVISFTGSTATGQLITQMSAPFFKKLSLEVSIKLFVHCYSKLFELRLTLSSLRSRAQQRGCPIAPGLLEGHIGLVLSYCRLPNRKASFEHECGIVGHFSF